MVESERLQRLFNEGHQAESEEAKKSRSFRIQKTEKGDTKRYLYRTGIAIVFYLIAGMLAWLLFGIKPFWL